MMTRTMNVDLFSVIHNNNNNNNNKNNWKKVLLILVNIIISCQLFLIEMWKENK